MKQFQKLIKLNELDYVIKNGRYYDFSEYSLSLVLLRDIHEGV